MGYTHYFKFVPKTGQASKAETAYQKAILDCQRIIKAYYKQFGGLSGYSAHTKLGAYGGLMVNGKGELGHEDFALREHYSQNESNYCKTNQKPYDLVVVACLAVLKHRLGDLMELSSNGNSKDWSSGVKFAQKVTGLKIKNPIGDRSKTDLSL